MKEWQRTSPLAAGERIRKLRRAKGWRHISDLERGTREPGLKTLP
jgi:hypothetical protein